MKPNHDDKASSQSAGNRFAKRETDERERASDGDWDSLRAKTRTDETGYTGDANDNPGGAGSTGSAATNSDNQDRLK